MQFSDLLIKNLNCVPKIMSIGNLSLHCFLCVNIVVYVIMIVFGLLWKLVWHFCGQNNTVIFIHGYYAANCFFYKSIKLSQSKPKLSSQVPTPSTTYTCNVFV